MTNDFHKSPTDRAFEAFLQWKEQGRIVAGLIEAAGMPIPDELNRAISGNQQDQGSKRIPIPAPNPPPRPPNAKDNWFWLKPSEVFIRTLVLGILSDKKKLPIKDLIKRVKKYLPDQNEGSIYNVGAQLEGEQIRKDDEGWLLIGDKAPILFENYIWGPESVFSKQDLASFRRMAIVHILTMHSEGLGRMQILKMLEVASWLRTVVNKELVKADLKIMAEEGRVRQLGSSLKWTVFEPSGQLMKKDK